LIDLIIEHVRNNPSIFGVDDSKALKAAMICQSRGKRYHKARIVFEIFQAGRPESFLYAKISRAPEYDVSLSKEFAVLQTLHRLDERIVIESVPRPLDLARIADRFVMFESAIPGETMLRHIHSCEPTNASYSEAVVTGLDSVENWLVEFQRVTRSGSMVMDKELVEKYVEPVLNQYILNVGSAPTRKDLCNGIRQQLLQVGDTSLPNVLVNGNLAPSTIVLPNRTKGIGVVDWKLSHWTVLPLREFYCFAHYMFVNIAALGLLGKGDQVDLWKQTFVRQDNWLSAPLQDFIHRLTRNMGISEKLGNILFGLFLMNEVNVQTDFAQLSDPSRLLEAAVLVAWFEKIGLTN